MQNYKDTNNKIHVLDSEEHEYLLPQGCVKITQEEADAINNRPLTNAQKIEALKEQLDTMERQAIMPRGAREAFIALCKQQGTAAGLSETQLYAANPFYKNLKDNDAIAASLRAQITALK